MNKELYNKNYDFNVKKYIPKLFRHFTPAALEWSNSIYVYDHNYIKSLPVADKHLMTTSLKLSFKTIFKIFSIKNVIEGIFLLLFILHVFSLDIDGLLNFINSILIANIITKLYVSLNSYKFTSVFCKKFVCYIQILDYIFKKYLTIKGIWPLISLIYFLFNDPYFLTPIVLASIIILIYINYINIKFKDNYPLLYIFLNFLCISILIYFIINQYIVYVGYNNKGSSSNMHSGYGGGDPKSPKPPRSEVDAWFKKKKESSRDKRFTSRKEYVEYNDVRSEILGPIHKKSIFNRHIIDKKRQPDYSVNYKIFTNRDNSLNTHFDWINERIDNYQNIAMFEFECIQRTKQMKALLKGWEKVDKLYSKKFNKKYV
jgi:hypothetical protein